jgi:hypothetical protein
MNAPENESLRKMLGEWKIDKPLPPRFQQEVWRRLEQRAQTPTVWETWQTWLENIFAKKSVTLSYVTVLLLAGLTVGYLHGKAHEQSWRAQLAQQYVQSIDPEQRPRP